MTNILPYSFTPGTKARAQEVNANFQSVMQAIDDSTSDAKSYALGKVQESYETLTEECDEKFINKKQITNIVLTCPNGIAELTQDEKNIVVKEGLTVLIPDGKNNDNTLKSIKYTVENDATMYRRIANSGTLHFFLTSDGNVYDVENYFTVNTSSKIEKNLCMYYVTEENKHYYKNDSGTISEMKAVYLGKFNNTSSSTTSTINTLTPIEAGSILTRTNIEELCSYGLPSGKHYSISVPASGRTVTMRYNGWLLYERTSSGSGQATSLKSGTTGMGSTVFSTASNQYYRIFIPVKKYDSVTVEYYGNAGSLTFIYSTSEI